MSVGLLTGANLTSLVTIISYAVVITLFFYCWYYCIDK